MSRIGKIPVVVPKGVKITVKDGGVLVEGPKGKLTFKLPLGIAVESKEDKLLINRTYNSKQTQANHGTTRAILANIIIGVTQGHKKNLEIQGVGFRAQAQGQKLTLNVGFSRPLEYDVPAGITVKTPKPTEIEVDGVDSSVVGEVAANIRRLKPPEPYKGKGIRYLGEMVRKKQGKTVTK
ncbi:MAG TPA: 50S ribosomal protein L6 [Candidatus Omnitrophota bacterium]|nr:50S ribosomal protein L6 [Candidatus Omnitrophota bacterium]HPD83951.1 50S ribosomal protein L6 [Candidatus Omnitrophota bacterium]HRZ02808.1 50S ribosomal protein L6 [Candidatus Omnitrophota bacterium]